MKMRCSLLALSLPRRRRAFSSSAWVCLVAIYLFLALAAATTTDVYFVRLFNEFGGYGLLFKNSEEGGSSGGGGDGRRREEVVWTQIPPWRWDFSQREQELVTGESTDPHGPVIFWPDSKSNYVGRLESDAARTVAVHYMRSLPATLELEPMLVPVPVPAPVGPLEPNANKGLPDHPSSAKSTGKKPSKRYKFTVRTRQRYLDACREWAHKVVEDCLLKLDRDSFRTVDRSGSKSNVDGGGGGRRPGLKRGRPAKQN